MGKEERPPLPACPGRADSVPPDEPIPASLPVFFAPYTQQPLSPAVAQQLLNFVDPEFANISPAEAKDVHFDDGTMGPLAESSPTTRIAAIDGAVVRMRARGSSCASPVFAAHASYEPELAVQRCEAEALKAFGELVDKDHRGIDDATTPTGPLPPHCDRAQFLLARDLARLRFLRARKLDPVEAVKMYVAALEWRRVEHVDTILDAPDPAETLFHCVCPHRNHGFDRLGHPIYWEKTGGVRMPRFLQHITEDDIVRRHVRMMEHTVRRCMYSSALNGRNVEKMTLVVDLADMQYTIETTGLKAFKRTTKIDQDFYPERLHRMFIINAPLSFRAVWAMVRPWLDPKTQEKITVVGPKFLPALSELIHSDHIPRSLGGNCDCSFANGDSCFQLPRAFPDADACGGWHNVF